jgi:hypothetical protein
MNMEELRKTTKTLNQDSRSPGRVLNGMSSTERSFSETQSLLTRPLTYYLVVTYFKI